MFFFLPLGTTRPHWRRPYATYGLMAVNLIVFFINPDYMRWGFLPAEASPVTCFTAMFVHGGILHLLGNMLFLWLFGTIAEDVLGPWVFLGFYFGSGVAAAGLDALMGILYLPDFLALPRIGASGAIAGIMGLSAVCFTYTKIRVWYLAGYFVVWRTGVAMIGAPVFLGFWLLWAVIGGIISNASAAYGLPPSVAHWAHVGGFAAGFGGALAFGLHKKVKRGDLVSGRQVANNTFEGLSQVGELEKLVEASPQDAQAWYALGRTWEMNGFVKEARKAYMQALILFLQQRRMQEAVRAYRAVAHYGGIISCPSDLQFELACACEEAGYPKEAFDAFREVVSHNPMGPQIEIALFRAGEIARTALKDLEKASECYRRLLHEYPHSHWRVLCQERIRQMGME